MGPRSAIRPAEFPGDLAVVRGLFRDYAADPAITLCLRDFEAELAALPGQYAPPAGRLLLAWDGAVAVGCVALRPVDAVTCEMKRLYVRPTARSQGSGRRLVEWICGEAHAAGYRHLCLDTLPCMIRAIGLYSALGFRPVAPYLAEPTAGAICLGLDL